MAGTEGAAKLVEAFKYGWEEARLIGVIGAAVGGVILLLLWHEPVSHTVRCFVNCVGPTTTEQDWKGWLENAGIAALGAWAGAFAGAGIAWRLRSTA